MPDKREVIEYMRRGLGRVWWSIWSVVWLVSACASEPQIVRDPPVVKDPWSFAERAIQLRLDADEMLNAYDGEHHTLVMCVYQLQNYKSYLSILKAEEGLSRLVVCQSFGEDVVSANRIIVNPAEVKEVALDRGENARFVALVVGYFDGTPKGSTKLYRIPVDTVEDGSGAEKTIHQRPGRLVEKIVLGPQAIEKTATRIKLLR